MELPQFIEKAGLDMNGIVWFRKTVELAPTAAGKSATLSLGPVDDSDETWVNGILVGSTKKIVQKKGFTRFRQALSRQAKIR